MLTILLIIFFLALAFLYIEKEEKFFAALSTYDQSCPECKVGIMRVHDYGSCDQFTETIVPCSDCGYIEDELRGV